MHRSPLLDELGTYPFVRLNEAKRRLSELADKLRRQWPGLPVIFMSAYANRAMTNHAADDPAVVLIPKPFTRSDLARTVRATLDQSRRDRPPLS